MLIVYYLLSARKANTQIESSDDLTAGLRAMIVNGAYTHRLDEQIIV